MVLLDVENLTGGELMIEESFDTTNIHLEWLKNIGEQLKSIQNMERLAREGCSSIIEFVNIQREFYPIIIPEAQYKNLKFIVLEISILLTNLSPILNNKENYERRLKLILNHLDSRDLFLSDIRINNQLKKISVLPFFYSTLKYILIIKADIIKDIGHLLFLPNEEGGINRKKW